MSDTLSRWPTKSISLDMFIKHINKNQIHLSALCPRCSNLAPAAHLSTESWIERIIILGASKPSKVTLKTAGECGECVHLHSTIGPSDRVA